MKFLKKNGLFIAEGILLFILCSLFVPACDDIIFRFDEFFQFDSAGEFARAVMYYGNGRFIGNSLLLIFSRAPQVFYALQFILLIVFSFLLEKLLEIKNLREYTLCIIALAPLPLFKECVAWMSAVINYFIPVFLLVLTALIVKKCFTKNSMTIWQGAGLFVLGFAGELFVEHYAILNLICTVILFIFLKIKKKKSAPALVLLMSEVLSAGLLFTYKLYVDITQTWSYNNSGTYRKLIIDEGSLGGMIKFAVTNVSYLVFVYSTAVVVFTLLLAVCMHSAKGKKIKAKPVLCLMSCMYYPLCAFCVYFQINQITTPKVALAAGVLVGVTAVGILGLLVQTVWQDLSKNQRLTVLFFTFIAVLYFAPFILVQPCSYRNCFMTYLILAVLVYYIADIERRKNGFALEGFNMVLQIVTVAVICIYIGFYNYEKNTIYKYKIENYQSEYYLPKANSRLVYAGESHWPGEHEYVDYKDLK